MIHVTRHSMIYVIAIALLLTLPSCMVGVTTYPTYDDCLAREYPLTQCEDHFVWLRGGYYYDGWGRLRWRAGRYHPRPVFGPVRDHRR
jgi:hypothetical protein